MGLFSLAPRKPSSASSSTDIPSSSQNSRHITPREARDQVRRDLHDKLGVTKGEQVFNIIGEDLDRDNFGNAGMSGREVDGMLQRLGENHQDNLHDRDISHIREILGKHLND